MLDEDEGACQPVIVRSTDELGWLYELNCPECGNELVTVEKIEVTQDGICTEVNRRGDTVREIGEIVLPGALVSLICNCDQGHRFSIGFLHSHDGTKIYVGRCEPEPAEPLWINENYGGDT